MMAVVIGRIVGVNKNFGTERNVFVQKLVVVVVVSSFLPLTEKCEPWCPYNYLMTFACYVYFG